ncbi:MAG: potassium-transporting ATPase subunit KdpB [bacterium]
MENIYKKSIWQKDIVIRAVRNSVLKLNPRTLVRNPVMFIVEIGSVITTIIALKDILTGVNAGFDIQISIWLWFTVLFANFAEALAEGKGKAQTETLRKTRSETIAKKILDDGSIKTIPGLTLVKGDIVIVEENDLIPCDGEIIEGVSLVDESAITGESAPVVRESGGDRSGVTGSTRLLSGKIKVRVTANPGETFLDQMVKMVENAKRQKTPNEKALEILLIGLTVLFLVVVITLKYFAGYTNINISIPILISLLVCLMPTTIGGLLPAIGIAGMDRLISNNVVALSGKAVEAAGDVSVVLLDKTGTLTIGNRMATEFLPAEGVSEEELAYASLFSSLADETPEGRSIVILAKEKLKIRGQDIKTPEGAKYVQFSVETRMSGIDIADSKKIRKGAVESIEDFAKSFSFALDGANEGKGLPPDVQRNADNVSGDGGTPLAVCENGKVLGIIRLKDILKQGIKERLHKLRLMGIESIMITGDNPLTAVVIAAEAGVSDFIAPAKPETKLHTIREFQSRGYMVAMIGDGTNDAPALAQADVAVAMNAGTQSAREAANMIDLDSNPTKLLDIVEVGKQILITRGALTTFSVANDVSKYFAIIPALAGLSMLNIMHLATPQSAVLSAVIFNAIIIPLLIPLSLRGVKYQHTSALKLLRNNALIYGLGGIILPFIGIKLIDILIVSLKLVH